MRRYLTPFIPAVLLTLLLTLSFIVVPPLPATATTSYEQELVDLINQERQSRGLSPLVIHNLLQDSAEAHSRDMGSDGFCGHSSSDGTTWSTRIKQYGYTPSYGLAENVACGQSTPQRVVSAWMGSSGHRANILGDYEHIGVGYYDSGAQGYGHYWTADFGKPAPDTPPPSCTLEYDFSGDGLVNGADVGLVSDCWHDNTGCDPAYDTNDDLVINVIDVMRVSSEWGASCP